MKDPMSIISGITSMLESVPGSKQILEDLREGKVGPEEATAKLCDIAIRAGHAESLSNAYERMRESFNEDNPRVWMDHANGSRVVNPVMVSAITERASLDGDVPEFRVGPIPEDGSPAVPVITVSLDSVNIGVQLELASKEVQSRIDELVTSHRELLESVNEQILSGSTAALAAAENLPPVPTGVMGYEEGRKAEPMAVREVKTTELATLSDTERSLYTYKALSTTQGRVSSALAIGANLVLALEKMGVKVSSEELPEFKKSSWETVCWGAGEVNPYWNPVTTAFNKWLALLQEECKEGDLVSLKVTPINGIPDRRFGWTLTLGKQEG